MTGPSPHARTRVERRRVTVLPAAFVATACGLAGFGSAAYVSGLDDAPVAVAGATGTAEPTLTPRVSASPQASGGAAQEDARVSVDVFDTSARSVDDPDSIWVVVNKVRPLDPLDYAPADLEPVDGVPGVTMRAEAAAALENLHEAAVREDAGFAASTAYRDSVAQEGLYVTYVGRSGQDAADRFSARPGYSEHQTGLAVDLHGSGCDLERCFATTPAGRFVAQHGWEHGFIVRYPEGKEDVTGYIYEPWHLRYVGVELATEMHEQEVATMEEFFGLEDAPDYE